MNQDISSTSQAFIMILAQQAIQVFVPIVLAILAALLLDARKFVKRHASASKLAILDTLVQVAINAAEKSGLKDELLKDGAAKKEFAISETQRMLNERGLAGISAATISAYIESALQQGLEQGPAVIDEVDAIAATNAADTQLGDNPLPWQRGSR